MMLFIKRDEQHHFLFKIKLYTTLHANSKSDIFSRGTTTVGNL